MRLKLSDLPELPAEPHPFLLQAVETIELADGRKVSYRQAGQGPAVLMLHGLWTTAYTFRSLLDPLAPNHRLIMPELTVPAGSDSPIQADPSPAGLARLALEMVDALSLERPLLVGHGECGLAALDLALEEPGRMAAAIVLGTSIELPLGARLSGWWRGRGQAKAWARAGFAQPDRAALEMLTYADPAVVCRQEVRQLAHGWANWPAAKARARLLAQTLTSTYRRKTAERIEAFAASGQDLPIGLGLVYGDADPSVPLEHGQRLNRMLPGSELLVADRSSGATQVERPAWTAEIIARFASSKS